MEYAATFLRDIFAGKFDTVVPVRACLIGIAAGTVLFLVRYFSYLFNKKRRGR